MHPLPLDPESVKGFMPASEGAELYRAVSLAPPALPCLEIGSYCGKSTIYLGAACQRSGRVLFAVDHHAGSEEHQPGEGYFDPELATADGQGVDTFGAFRRTVRAAALDDTVVPIVAPSAVAARAWATPLGLLFIDGGHSRAAAQTDYAGWVPKLAPGGILLIHDIFPNPADGGRPPYELWCQAQESGDFEVLGLFETLGMLRKRSSSSAGA